MTTDKIYFAPLQSYTNLPYYWAYDKIIGGIYKYFIPFYRSDNKGNFSFEKYLLPVKNMNLIPQVITNKGSELLLFAKEIESRGFKEININIGCPFPMVVNRKLGAGLLPHGDLIKIMLDEFFNGNLDLKLSVKLRLGLQKDTEINDVLEVLDQYPVEEVIVHPRLGIQKYKGSPDWDKFESLLSKKRAIVGNGDIVSKIQLKKMYNKYPQVNGWMIGRGLLINPCLLNEEMDWRDTIIKLHDAYVENINKLMFSEQQALNYLKCFWEYPCLHLNGGIRILRKIKKVGHIYDYVDLMKRMMDLPYL